MDSPDIMYIQATLNVLRKLYFYSYTNIYVTTINMEKGSMNLKEIKGRPGRGWKERTQEEFEEGNVRRECCKYFN